MLGGVAALAVSGAVITWWRIGHPRYAQQALPAGLVSADSGTGRELLAGAEAAADYKPLLRWFVPQQKLTWSGPATATVVLNALRLNEPGPPLRQPQILGGLRARWAASLHGVTFDQLAGLFTAHGALTTLHYASEDSESRFRTLTQGNLADPSDFLVVAFDRGGLHESGGTQFSPVGAWDRDTDRVLVLDTASFRYPFTWVRVPDLFEAMEATDDAGRTLGYLVVRRGERR